MTPAIKAAFDKQPMVRLAAAKVHLRSYVAATPQHDLGLCHWLALRGVGSSSLVHAYREACGEKPPFFKWVDFNAGPTQRRLAFAKRLLDDIEAYLSGAV